jgi:hypothetical protein
MARKFSNVSVATTLSSGIDSSQTAITINDTGGLPATFPFSLVIDFEASTVEVVTVTNLSGGMLTVTRGQDGTAAQSHSAGAVVVHGVTARDLSEPQLHIDATSEVHGLPAGSNLVGTAMPQTLTNKTVTFDDNTLTGVASTSTAQIFTSKTIAFSDNTLTDVASLDTAQTLTNKTITAADNTLVIDIADLGDVGSNAPDSGDVLTWDSGESEWSPAPIPSIRLATTILTSDSAGTVANGTEELGTVAAPLVSGQRYQVRAALGFRATEDGDSVHARIHEDSSSGTVLQDKAVPLLTTTVTGYGLNVEAEYTAVATGSKTFSVVADSFGTNTGTVRMEASPSAPGYIYINRIV